MSESTVTTSASARRDPSTSQFQSHTDPVSSVKTDDAATMKTKQSKCRRPEQTRKALVLLAAFVCQMFSLGFAFSLGVFFVEFLEAFPVGRAQVSWATSLCSGILFGAGLIVGLIVDRVGPRLCTMLGGLVSTAGILASSFVTRLPVLYVTFGIITGTGLCLVQLSSAVSIGQHFRQGRAAATSLASVGAGIGSLSFPVLLRLLIDEYGWRGALMIFSGVVLNVVPIGMLFVPAILKHGLEVKHKTDTEYDGKCMEQNVSGKKISTTNPIEDGVDRHTEDKYDTTLSDVSVETQEDLKATRRKHCCPGSTTLCSVAIWKNPVYMLYLVICPIISTGYSFPYVTLVDLGQLQGIDIVRSTYLLTYISAATAVSTFLTGALLKPLHKHSINIFTASLVIMGTILFVFPSLVSYGALICGAVFYGIAMGGLTGTYAVMVADILGLGLYAMGFGFVCTGYGIGYLLGTPFAGWITDITGNYNISFYIAGSLCLGSAAFFVFSRILIHILSKK